MKVWHKRIIFAIWGGLVAFICVAFCVFFAISKGFIGYMPPVEQLENPIDKYASQVISSDGQWLGSFHRGKDNRVNVTYNELSPDLVKALIAVEDIRYVKHSGIDIKGLIRAIIKTGLLRQKSSGGGSTITQQLAKQLYSPGVSTLAERILQKPIEWVIAVQLERYYTKEEIVNLYLNQFDFLYNAVGIKSASRVYFDATPGTLKTEEAATLIGMCKNPSYYNPIRYIERTRERRNMVLSQMKKAGYLNAAVCDSLTKLPLETRFTRLEHTEGLAPYFREYLRVIMIAKKPERSNYPYEWQKQQFVDDSTAYATNPLYGWCNKNRKPNGDPYDLYADGLKIYTTVNSYMQRYAEEAVAEHIGKTVQPDFVAREIPRKKNPPFSNDLTDEEVNSILNRSVTQSDRYRILQRSGMSDADIRKTFEQPVDMRVFSWGGVIDTTMTPMDSIRYYKSFLHSGFMAMDPHTGHVKAYVGGIDFNSFKYDMVSQSRRQIGSTMKPFVYALAMVNGVNPGDRVMNVQPVLYDENGIKWEPRNANAERIGEEVTVQWGLQNSSNWVTATIMDKYLSPYTLARFLQSLGFKSEIVPVIAMCLGTPDISVSEMVSAYTIFSNNGIRTEPLFVTRIENANGNMIASFTAQSNEVLDENSTYKTLGMLRSTVDGGTASRVRYRYGIRAPMGGKTGTTNNHSDGWFLGFTPSLVAGCWVGGDDRSIHFDRISEGQGAQMALPIFALFMQKVYANKTLGYSETENFDISGSLSSSSEPVEQITRLDTQPVKLDDFFE